jgi:hypothetical protein
MSASAKPVFAENDCSLALTLDGVAVFAETGCYAQAQAVGEHIAIGRDGRA